MPLSSFGVSICSPVSRRLSADWADVCRKPSSPSRPSGPTLLSSRASARCNSSSQPHTMRNYPSSAPRTANGPFPTTTSSSSTTSPSKRASTSVGSPMPTSPSKAIVPSPYDFQHLASSHASAIRATRSSSTTATNGARQILTRCTSGHSIRWNTMPYATG